MKNFYLTVVWLLIVIASLYFFVINDTTKAILICILASNIVILAKLEKPPVQVLKRRILPLPKDGV